MRRKLDITVSEMMEYRRQGMSNHDIAKLLDISVVTVRRYIGKQGGRMAHMSAFADNQPDITIEPEEAAAAVDDFQPKMTAEAYTVNTQSGACLEMEIHYAQEFIKFTGLRSGWSAITFSEARELVRLLAWASRRIDEREV